MEVTPLKDGIRTTEFWGKVVVQGFGALNAVLGLLSLFGVVKYTTLVPDPALVQIVAGLLATVVPEVFYAISRGQTKAAHSQAQAAVLLAQVQVERGAGPFLRR